MRLVVIPPSTDMLAPIDGQAIDKLLDLEITSKIDITDQAVPGFSLALASLFAPPTV